MIASDVPLIAVNPGEQSVEPVDEVDGVHHSDVPDQGERVVPRYREVDVIAAVERILDVLDHEPVEQRDPGDHDLRDELVARPHPHDVVPDPDHQDQDRAEQQADHVVDLVEVTQLVAGDQVAERREQREREAEEDRDPADSRLGLLVHPPVAAQIGHPDVQREPSHERRRERRRGRRDGQHDAHDDEDLQRRHAGSPVACSIATCAWAKSSLAIGSG